MDFDLCAHMYIAVAMIEDTVETFPF